MESNQVYDTNQEIARQLWNSMHSTSAVYVQWCGGDEWRVSDIHGSIVGYIDINQKSIKMYGAKA